MTTKVNNEISKVVNEISTKNISAKELFSNISKKSIFSNHSTKYKFDYSNFSTEQKKKIRNKIRKVLNKIETFYIERIKNKDIKDIKAEKEVLLNMLVIYHLSFISNANIQNFSANVLLSDNANESFKKNLNNAISLFSLDEIQKEINEVSELSKKDSNVLFQISDFTN